MGDERKMGKKGKWGWRAGYRRDGETHRFLYFRTRKELEVTKLGLEKIV